MVSLEGCCLPCRRSENTDGTIVVRASAVGVVGNFML